MKKDLILDYKNAIGLDIDLLAKDISSIIKIKHEIIFRVKSIQSLINKMELKGVSNPLLIKDIYGIKIIVDSTKEIYSILSAIQLNFTGCVEHDYIRKPKMCRYDEQHKGKFLRLIKYTAYKNKIPFEIQITTREFEVINELLHDGHHKIKYKK